ncbi:MAG: serine protease AprX [Blastocatellia bacterium]|jgi:serine protease AprX|nr:serine protease AprX [Blastocatellia bacterium]
MKDTLEIVEDVAPVSATRADVCPVCDRSVEGQLFAITALPADLRAIIVPNAATANAEQVCGRCLELFERARRQIESQAAIFEQNDFVLPTPLRMDADERFTGRGITIAFLDSGFYAHPDLTKPNNRILAYHSIFTEAGDQTSLETNDVASWHGMMTSVVATGNGGLTDGFYRGIASDANVVLVKIGRTGRISEDQIQQGLEWVLAHMEEHQIRVINISAGGDFEESYLTNPLSQTVERCVRAGLTVVCAVGNAGHFPGHPVLPPASAPSCIAVGGLDDQNSLDRARRGMYRSSYGPTSDGLQKPEVIAPGIWVAAPILPHTPTAEEAELYSKLNAADDDTLRAILESNAGVDKDLDEARALPIPLLRQLITVKLREGNVINQHYKYVDGTSFAAPIVSSIIACMLEANPRLTPQQIKRLLIDTAERVPDVEVDRQGWGVVSARLAVELAVTSA